MQLREQTRQLTAIYNRILLWITFLTCLLSVTAKAVEVSVPVGEPCSEMFTFRGEAYFCADHPVHGKELFVSDGGRFSTRLVIDLDPGPGGSGPYGFFELHGKLFFFAETTATGYALWRTDGTDSGTKKIRSISQDFSVFPTVNSRYFSSPATVAAKIGGLVYFEGSSKLESHSPIKLLRTDGTASGTVEIANTFLTSGFSSSLSYWPATQYTVYKNRVYYLSRGELHRVANGVSTKIATLPFNGDPPATFLSVSNYDGKLLINTFGGIWLSDGTPAGTRAFRRNQYGPGGKFTINVVVSVTSNTLIYFRRDENGTPQLRAATNARDKLLVTPDGGVRYVYSDSNYLFFTDSKQLYSTDGSAVVSIATPDKFNRIEEHLGVFYGLTAPAPSSQSQKLARIDPSTLEMTTIKNDLSISRFIGSTTAGILFSTASAQSTYQLWISDGTTQGARRLSTIPNSDSIFPAHNEGGRQFFINQARSGEDANELWHTNGTADSTYRLMFQFENGLPPEDDSEAVLPTILQLLLDEERESPQSTQ